MIRYKTITIASSSDSESLSDALAGLGEKKRKIRALYFKPNTSSTGSSLGHHGRAYVQRDQIVDIDIDLYLQSDSDANPINRLDILPRVEVNITLERGQGFEVGFYKSGGPSSSKVTMEYEDLE